MARYTLEVFSSQSMNELILFMYQTVPMGGKCLFIIPSSSVTSGKVSKLKNTTSPPIHTHRSLNNSKASGHFLWPSQQTPLVHMFSKFSNLLRAQPSRGPLLTARHCFFSPQLYLSHEESRLRGALSSIHGKPLNFLHPLSQNVFLF